MKIILFSFIIVFAACSPQTNLFLVRHAEKTDNSRDPDLSDTGKLRAQRLSELLAEKSIKKIFSTDYKRTLQTALPLAERRQIEIQKYSPDTLKQFGSSLLQQKQNTLVVGHSNSTLSLLDAMGIQHSIKLIEDNDYTNLFIISLRGKKPRLVLEEKKY